MLQNLLEKKVGNKSESEGFDDRTNFALSEGVMKTEELKKSFDYVEYDNWMKFETDKKYFQKRISHERELLRSHPDNIKLLTRVGDIYAANNKPDKANIYFRKAFSKDLKNLSLAKRIVETYLSKGKPEQADSIFELVEAELDDATLHLHAVIKIMLNKLEEADKLIENIPSSSRYYYEVVNSRGLIALNKNKNIAARKFFEESIKHNENYAPAKSNLALSLQNMGETENAVEQYKKTIAEHHDYLVAYDNLFNLYVKLEEFEYAYKLMDSARDLITPTNEIQFRIAWSLMSLGRWEEAVTEYEKVLELIPNNPSTINNIGHCYFNMGDIDKAYEMFYKASRSPGNKGIHLLSYRNLMILSERKGKIEESRRIARNLLVHFPHDPIALVFRGEELVQEEEWEHALRLLERAYQDKPPLVTLYVSLAMIYSDIYPDYEKGKEVCQYVIDTEMERSGEILNNFVHLHLVHGNVKDAEKYLKFLNQENPISLCTLALYQLQIKNLETAIEMYDKAIRLVNSKYKDKVIQRKNYDLGVYFLSENELTTSRDYLEKAINYENGFKYIQSNADDLLQSLESE